MTIAADQANRYSYTGNGVTTTFAYSSAFMAQADLIVTVAGVTKVLNTDYTITGTTDSVGRYPSGASIVFGVAPANAASVVIYGDPSIAQSLDLVENDPFPAESVEKQLDTLTIFARRLKDLVTRSFRLADTDTSGASVTIPTPSANTILQWNAGGTALQNATLAGSGTVVLPGGTGIAAYTGANTFVARTLTAADGTITIANGDGQAGNPTIKVSANSIAAQHLTTSTQGFSLVNGTFVASVNANVLTLAIKTLAGGDPSATDPVYVRFRNATAGTGDFSVLTLTAATSIATTVGATFGVANNVSFRLWVVGFNDAGTFRLGLINCLSTVAGAGAGRDVTAIFPLAGWGIASSTQIGAGSTLASTFYTAGAGVASKAYATLGYLTYEAGLATAGSFASTPSRVQLFSHNDPLPGQTIQVQRTATGAVATGTTLIPLDNTIPQNTEGDQYMTQAITPTSAANILAIETKVHFSHTAAAVMIAALFQDATANALAVGMAFTNTIALRMGNYIHHRMLSALTAATTFKVRLGAHVAGTTAFNGDNTSSQEMGGVMNSFIQVQEIMG